MEHDFDPMTQYCRACGLPRVVVEDKPKFAACTGSARTRDMYGLTIAQLRRMRVETPTKIYCLPEDLETAKRLIGDVDVPLPERGFGV